MQSPEFFFPIVHVSIAPVSIEPVSIAYVSIPQKPHLVNAPPSITHIAHTKGANAIPTCTMTITPDKNGYVPPGTCIAMYDDYPNFNAAMAFTVLFSILTVIRITQAAIY